MIGLTFISVALKKPGKNKNGKDQNEQVAETIEVKLISKKAKRPTQAK